MPSTAADKLSAAVVACDVNAVADLIAAARAAGPTDLTALLDASDFFGRPFVTACARADKSPASCAIASLLVKAGAPLTVRGGGNSPLSAALRCGCVELAAELLDAGAPVGLLDADGTSVLHHAAALKPLLLQDAWVPETLCMEPTGATRAARALFERLVAAGAPVLPQHAMWRAAVDAAVRACAHWAMDHFVAAEPSAPEHERPPLTARLAAQLAWLRGRVRDGQETRAAAVAAAGGVQAAFNAPAAPLLLPRTFAGWTQPGVRRERGAPLDDGAVPYCAWDWGHVEADVEAGGCDDFRAADEIAAMIVRAHVAAGADVNAVDSNGEQLRAGGSLVQECECRAESGGRSAGWGWGAVGGRRGGQQ